MSELPVWARIDSIRSKVYKLPMNKSNPVSHSLVPGIIRILIFLVFFLPGTGHAQFNGNSSLYRLIGTIQSGAFAGAVLDDTAGLQTFYRLHERLPDGSQVVKVQSDSISIKRSDGSSYDLVIIHDSKPGSQQARPVANVAAAPPILPVVEQKSPAQMHREGTPVTPAPAAAVSATGAERTKPGRRNRVRPGDTAE